MNILKKITIVALLVALRPSFACACGGDLPLSYHLFAWVMWGIMLLIYLIPSIYYVLRFNKHQLSIINLLLSHLGFAILFLLSNYHYELGLNPFLNQLSHYVSVTMLFMLCSLVGVILWIYPAIHTYAKGMEIRQRA